MCGKRFSWSHLLFDYCIWGSYSAGQHWDISTATVAHTPCCLLRLHAHTIMSNHWGLVWSYLANVFWLLIYLISFNRLVIEIHQKFLSVHSPLMSVSFQHLFRLHYWGSSLGPLIPQSDRVLVTEIINLKTVFAAIMLIKNCLLHMPVGGWSKKFSAQ